MLNTKTITELKDLCQAFDIEYTKNARKQDIIDVIKEAGISWEDYENSSQSLTNFTNKEKEEIKVAKQDSLKDNVWLTMVHKRAALQVGSLHFDMDEPFILVDANLAREILKTESNEVREATPAEVYAFENGE